jgi:hypothetical protein
MRQPDTVAFIAYSSLRTRINRILNLIGHFGVSEQGFLDLTPTPDLQTSWLGWVVVCMTNTATPIIP